MKKLIAGICAIMVCLILLGCFKITIEPLTTPTPTASPTQEPTPTPTPTASPTPTRINADGKFWFTRSEYQTLLENQLSDYGLSIRHSYMEIGGYIRDIYASCVADEDTYSVTYYDDQNDQIIFLANKANTYKEQYVKTMLAIVRVCEPSAYNNHDVAADILSSLFDTTKDANIYEYNGLIYMCVVKDNDISLSIQVKK